jgi:hypothetical protein
MSIWSSILWFLYPIFCMYSKAIIWVLHEWRKNNMNFPNLYMDICFWSVDAILIIERFVLTCELRRCDTNKSSASKTLQLLAEKMAFKIKYDRIVLHKKVSLSNFSFIHATSSIHSIINFFSFILIK